MLVMKIYNDIGDDHVDFVDNIADGGGNTWWLRILTMMIKVILAHPHNQR